LLHRYLPEAEVKPHVPRRRTSEGDVTHARMQAADLQG
jgi:hypothetical protein